MDATIIGCVKAVLLTEALAHAVKSWGIFDDVRSRIAARCEFLRRLLACFECVSVWSAAVAVTYLYFLDFWPITFIIILQRAATIFHMAIDGLDAWRASTINKI